MHHDIPIQGLEPSVFGEQKLKMHDDVPIQGLEPSVFGQQKLKMQLDNGRPANLLVYTYVSTPRKIPIKTSGHASLDHV